MRKPRLAEGPGLARVLLMSESQDLKLRTCDSELGLLDAMLLGVIRKWGKVTGMGTRDVALLLAERIARQDRKEHPSQNANLHPTWIYVQGLCKQLPREGQLPLLTSATIGL